MGTVQQKKTFAINCIGRGHPCIHALPHGYDDYMTDPAKRAESVKILVLKCYVNIAVLES